LLNLYRLSVLRTGFLLVNTNIDINININIHNNFYAVCIEGSTKTIFPLPLVHLQYV
jgi:hypothetical protein